jgi:hypothetical protein
MKRILLIITVFALQNMLITSIIFAQSYASMYSTNSTQAVSGWTTLTGFTSSTPDERSSDWSYAGGVLTASTNSAGLYMVSFSISFSGTQAGLWQPGISVDNIDPTNTNSISIIRNISNTGDQGNASATGYINIVSGQTIRLKVLPPSNANITINYAQVTLVKLSDISSYNEYAETKLYNNSNFQNISTTWQDFTSTTPGFTTEHISNWTHNNGVLTAGGVTTPGTYLVNANFSFFGSSGLVFDFGVSKNDGVPYNLISGRKISNINNDIGNVTIYGLITINQNDNVRIKVKGTGTLTGTETLTTVYSHLSLIKINSGTIVNEPFPYASMYQFSGDPVAQSLADGIATQLAGYSNDVTDANFWAFNSNQLNPIGISAGIYRVNYFLSYSTDAGNNKMVFKVYNGNTELTDLTISRSTSNANDRGAVGGNGIIEIANPTDLIRVIAVSNKAANISVYRSRLTLSRIEKTSDLPLPVELSSFSASIVGSSIKLNWKTETEVNNYGFEVERYALSAERQAWEKIGFVNGNGNSNSPKSYSFEDKNVTAGKYSYRLKQIDNDGQFEYSKAIEVDFGVPKKFELSQNYPNPFNPTTTIRFNLPEATNVKLTLFNILGQEVKTLVNESKESGVHTINFNATELNSGIYIYKLESGSFTQTRKMTLVK